MPKWKELRDILKRRRGRYALWLSANFGGLFVAYAASFTIWGFHKSPGTYLPTPEVILITATVTLAVTGVSYLTVPSSHMGSLLPSLSFAWAFLLAAVYGVLIAMGAKPPAIQQAAVWWIILVIAALCWIWASITWLHEQGIREDFEGGTPGPPPPREDLRAAAASLPKFLHGGQGADVGAGDEQ